MPALKKIAFLLDEFALRTPGQQLLDRFLIGYPRDGVFRRPLRERVVVHVASGADVAGVTQRAKDFGLQAISSAQEAAAGADFVVVAPAEAGKSPTEAVMRAAVDSCAAGAWCFSYGALSDSGGQARALVDHAAARGVRLTAGTAFSVANHLPEVPWKAGTELREALIVVQGGAGIAELQALDGLWPILEARRGGETGVRRVRYAEGANVWKAEQSGVWSKELLGAAISRSHTPQGDPVRDGRTQDLVGLGLVPKLARAPRGWFLEHADGLRTAVLVLDGVVEDFNFAVRAAGGEIHSAQLFRGPPPAEHHFSRLAAALEDATTSGAAPWPADRPIRTATLLESFRRVDVRDGGWHEVQT